MKKVLLFCFLPLIFLAVACSSSAARLVQEGNEAFAGQAYDEALTIRRDLAARDPGNTGWARDVWVSYWRLADADPANASAHWAEVVARMEDMAARGILLPTDQPWLDTARANLAAARR